MIDIHSHILPGVDDGSRSLEMSENMLCAYVAQGIDKVICTPHQNADLRRPELLLSRFQEFKKVAERYGVTSYLGAEIYYYEKMLEGLASGELLTMNGTKYVLVEFSTRSDMAYIPDAVYELSIKGYKPIVAHIERYPYIGTAEYNEIKQNGGLIQVNASSFEKKDHAKTLKYLLKNDIVDFIASDCHSDGRRSANFSAARSYIAKKFPGLEEKFFGNNNIFEK